MNADPINMIHTGQQSNKACTNNLKNFYINQSNQLKQKSMKTQPAPSLQPSTNLQGNQICMSGLDTSHRQFDNTPEYKFWYRLTLIQSMQTNRSTIKHAKMIIKTPDNNTWRIINKRNKNNLYRLKCISINQ